MADYAVQADLERAAGGAAKLLNLVDHDGDGSIDSVGLAAVINDASRWIDSYLARRYDVPLGTPSDIIRRVCAEEAVYQLLRQRDAAAADNRLDHEEAERWLEGVRDGAINPGIDPPPAKSTAVAARAGGRDTVSPARITRDTLKGLW